MNFSRRRTNKSSKYFYCCSLACSIGTKKAENLSIFNIKGYSIYSAYVIFIIFPKFMHRNAILLSYQNCMLLSNMSNFCVYYYWLFSKLLLKHIGKLFIDILIIIIRRMFAGFVC